jgi:phosphate-selective porin OprO/OprP
METTDNDAKVTGPPERIEMNNRRLKLKLWLLAAVLGAPASQPVLADDAADIAALKAEVQELDQKIRILERNRELDRQDASESAKTLPQITVGANGITFESANTNFAVSLHGVVQLDTRTFQNDNNVPGNSAFLLRRARPILTGTVYRDFDYNFTPDFGNGTAGNASAAATPIIYDAYVNYRYSPALQIEAGKFKAPVGLEQLQSDVNLSFNERSLVTDLVPNRDLGFEVHGEVKGGLISYAAGVFNGVGDARNSSNYSFQDNRELDGRLFVQPFKASSRPGWQNLGVGVGGDWGTASITNTLGLPSSTGGGSTSAGYFTEGQQQFFAYNSTVVARSAHWRISPQASYYYGPLGLLAEYVVSAQGVENTSTLPIHAAYLQNTAWEVSGGWVLTGENASFNGVIPKHPFDPRQGHWGAWQVVGRYEELNVDPKAFSGGFANSASASAAQAWAVGLNWYLNQNIRADASYAHTTFTGGESAVATSAPGSVSSHPEDVFFTRLQLAF